MSNYGTNIGKGTNFGGPTKIKTTTQINKKNISIAISITIGIAIIVVIFVFCILRSSKTNIVGKWKTDDGKVVEFLSDGTLHEGGSYDSLNADTYEIIDEGYLKLGQYDAAWIQYRYTYWDINISGNKMTLTLRNNPNKIIELTKE